MGMNSVPAVSGFAKLSDLPRAATDVPLAEMKGGQAGTQLALFDAHGHSHPRVSCVMYAVSKSTGLSDPIMFDQIFDKKPGVIFTAEDPNGAMPPIIVVNNWITNSDGKYTGCVAKAYRVRMLPALTSLSVTALLTAVVTGINNIVAALSGYNPTEAATGLSFSVVAIKQSS